METTTGKRHYQELDQIVARFGGDSGDGVQLIGELFTSASTAAGNDVATLPDYPAEIRAPAGTVAGVSGYQMCFGATTTYTPGDEVDVLVAMNPAALKVNLPRLRKGAMILVNEDSFAEKNLQKAGYPANPLASDELKSYRVHRIAMSGLTQAALASSGLSPKQVDRCKNFLALGIMYSLFDRQKEYALAWLKKKFGAKPEILEANLAVFEAGWKLGADEAAFPHVFRLSAKKRELKPGTYRQVSGNTAAAFGLLAAAERSGLRLFLGSYPITPATDILQELTKHPKLCTVFQAEDEIAGIGTAVGAAFAGALAATSTSGPGFSLKGEFMGLAVMAELPIVIINVQRAGPSTGIPTKTEQADLLQALWGRHGESPAVVVAASSPKDCFDATFEAARIALQYMTPVIVLTDGYLGNGSEVWRVPNLSELPKIPVRQQVDADGFKPYARDPDTLARVWAVPGTPKLEHRLGGLEKEDGSGSVSAGAVNHEKMVKLRAEKVERVAREIPEPEVYGVKDAELLVVGWGSTFGVIRQAVEKLLGEGVRVASTHLRYLNPLPTGLEGLLKKYRKVLVIENNTGQLWYHLRGKYLIPAERLNKVQGQPFQAGEIEAGILSLLKR